MRTGSGTPSNLGARGEVLTVVGPLRDDGAPACVMLRYAALCCVMRLLPSPGNTFFGAPINIGIVHARTTQDFRTVGSRVGHMHDWFAASSQRIASGTGSRVALNMAYGTRKGSTCVL